MPTEPRADDPGALVREARQCATVLDGVRPSIAALLARLADALVLVLDQIGRRERAEAAALSAERSAWGICERLKQERDAARADATEQRARAARMQTAIELRFRAPTIRDRDYCTVCTCYWGASHAAMCWVGAAIAAWPAAPEGEG